MPQTSHRPSIPSQIFDLLPEFRGREFISQEIASRIPWIKPVHVYAALNGFVSRGILSRAGTRAQTGAFRGKKNLIVYRVVEPFSDPKTWRSTAEGRLTKSGVSRPRDAVAPPKEYRFYKDRLEAMAQECDDVVDDLIGLGAKVENLKARVKTLDLSMFSDLEISREYHARKRARGQE